MHKLMHYYATLVFVLITLNEGYSQRNPLDWPFSSSSIWNMPIGSEAVFIPAGIEPALTRGMTVDEDIIVLQPDAPLAEIYTNYAGWDSELDRCIEEGPLLFTAPIPTNFIVSPENWDGLTPNSGLAVLMPDGETILQTQPFSRCTPSTATSRWTPPAVNLYDDGIRGAHGGSGLSAIGGTLRLGELDEPDDTIRHALKVNLFAAKNLYYDEETEGFRWPAIRADGYAANVYGTERTTAAVTACRMGALLGIPSDWDLASLGLETQPAQILARALQQYGAYVVDDTAWDVWALITEWSPTGRFTEEFEAAWGFPFIEADLETPWSRDMRRLFTNLHVVDNNGPNQIGGGGSPLVPLAPPLLPNSTSSPTSQIRIFPNPTQGTLNVTGTDFEPQLTLYNALGQIVLEEKVIGEQVVLPASLRSGFYFLQITRDKGIIITNQLLIIE